MQFNEEEFYNPSLPNQKIHIYNDTDPIPIDTLDDYETTRILDDIDITHQEDQNIEPEPTQQEPMQYDLGGGSTITAEQDAELDHATPYIQYTSNSNEPQQQDDNNDEILGD